MPTSMIPSSEQQFSQPVFAPKPNARLVRPTLGPRVRPVNSDPHRWAGLPLSQSGRRPPQLLLVFGETGQRQRGKFLRHFLDAQAPLRVVPFIGPVQHPEEPVGGDPDIEIGAKLTVPDSLIKYS